MFCGAGAGVHKVHFVFTKEQRLRKQYVVLKLSKSEYSMQVKFLSPQGLSL